jgi:alpha/beta superfamily hydrolase
VTGTGASTAQAVRVDDRNGTREVAESFGPDGSLFGFTHLPAAPAVGGVVVCSPLYAEFIRNYRREVLIGRRLAELGIAVQRFHYKGQGNSAEGVTTFGSMRGDAIEATMRLQELAHTDRLAFFGTRLGALVAASAAAELGDHPLAMWDPVLDGSRYVTEIFRASRIHALKAGRSRASVQDLDSRLERNGTIDVFGYSISRAVHESSVGKSLVPEVGGTPRRLLLIQLGRDRRTSTQYADAMERWRRIGFNVDHRIIGAVEPWWFSSGALVARESLTGPVDVTVTWFHDALGMARGIERG